MTTQEIEIAADPGDLAKQDWNIHTVLKRQVVPEYIMDVGHVSWTRKHVSLALAAAQSHVDITAATYVLSKVLEVFVGTDFDHPMTYIGDEPKKVLAAKSNTASGKPGSYYVESSGSMFSRLGFDKIADTAYTIWITHELQIIFASDTDVVDLDPYIPSHYQWALVEGLKRELYRDRFGVADPRYVAAKEEFERWKQRASKTPELARPRSFRYAR